MQYDVLAHLFTANVILVITWFDYDVSGTTNKTLGVDRVVRARTNDTACEGICGEYIAVRVLDMESTSRSERSSTEK
jgi:hypothetical protein